MLDLEHVLGTKQSTRVWVHKKQLYVVGPGAAALLPWLTPHEAINANPIVAVFREDLRVRNPFSDTAFAKVLADAPKFGLELTGALEAQKKRLSEELRPSDIHAFDAAEQSDASRVLRSLADRAWRLDGSNRCSRTIPLWLRHAAASPKLVTSHTADDLCVSVSMGAGRILNVRLVRFVGTPATPLRIDKQTFVEGQHVDGGNVRLWLTTDYDEMLEGDVAAPWQHRRDAAYSEAED